MALMKKMADMKPKVFFRHVLGDYCGVNVVEPSKLLVWSMGIVSVVALTAYGFVPLIWEYRDNNVVTQVQVVLLDDYFRPPQMVLVLPRAKVRNKYGDDLMILAASLYANNGTCGPEALEICDKLKRSSLDVWNGRFQDFNRTSLETFYRSLTLAFLEKIFTNPNPLELCGSDLNEPVISSLFNFIGWTMMIDYSLTPAAPERGFDLNLYPGVDMGQKFEKFDHKYELLHKRMLEILCTKMEYTELDYPDEFTDPVPNNKTCSDLIFNSAGPVYIGGGLTVAFPEIDRPTMKEYRFKFPQQSRSLENSSLLAAVNIDPVSKMSLFADAGCLYRTVLDHSYTPPIFQSPSEPRKIGQKITVKYKVQMRARETRSTKIPCSNKTSIITCFMQCTKLWIIDECKCASFGWKKGLQHPNKERTPNCSPISFTKCNVTVLPETITHQCKEKCKSPCDYTIYTWQISYDTFKPKDDDVNEFIVKMVPLFDTFAEFTWILKDTPEQFFSQLAGVGSFYLGFSGLSVVSVIIWCMDLWKKFKKRQVENKEKGSQANEAEDENSWRLSGKSCRHEFCGNSDEKPAFTIEGLRLLWQKDIDARQAMWQMDIHAAIEKKFGSKE